MKKIILFLVLLQVCNLQAQQMHLVVKSNGTQYATQLSNVRKISFIGGTVTVVKKVGTQETYSPVSLDKMFFELRTVTSVTTPTNIDFVMYPNPATDIVSIQSVPENTQIDVYNINGVKMISCKSTVDITQINISSLGYGVYLVKIGNYKTLKLQKS